MRIPLLHTTTPPNTRVKLHTPRPSYCTQQVYFKSRSSNHFVINPTTYDRSHGSRPYIHTETSLLLIVSDVNLLTSLPQTGSCCSRYFKCVQLIACLLSSSSASAVPLGTTSTTSVRILRTSSGILTRWNRMLHQPQVEGNIVFRADHARPR